MASILLLTTHIMTVAVFAPSDRPLARLPRIKVDGLARVTGRGKDPLVRAGEVGVGVGLKVKDPVDRLPAEGRADV